MEPIFLTVLLLILILVQIFILVGTAMFVYGNIVSSVPLVPVKRKALKAIVDALELSSGNKLYDLGSGDGRVLDAALIANPEIKAVGLEIAPLPRLISKLKLRNYGPKVEIRNQNFFKADFSDATHIYIYLYPSVMKRLEPIFDSGLRPGTRVVSCDFPFTDKQPEKTVTVPNSKTLSKTLYVYIW